MSKEEIIELIANEFEKEYGPRIAKIEAYFPTVKNRPKRIKKSKRDQYIENTLKKVLR